MLFAVKNGAIVDLVESVADALPPELQRQECEAPEDGNAPYVTAVTVRNDHGTAPPSRDEKDKPFWEHNPGPLARIGIWIVIGAILIFVTKVFLAVLMFKSASPVV